MFIFTEKTFENILHNKLDIFYEAESNSFIIRDELYPKVENVLKTEDGIRKFTRIVENFINKNNTKLTTIGPMYMIAFTTNDHKMYYDLFNTSENEIRKIVLRVIKNINDKANWTLAKNNPFFILAYCIIRYFTLTKNDKHLKSALAITALAYYPSMFTKYFQFEPNAGVMQYTIDNLSQRFLIKKSNHIFGTLMASIQGSWAFHEIFFTKGYDSECIRFIQRIRNDQNSLFKKIASNYYDNYKKGLTIYTTVDSYDDSVVVDNENDSNRVESITNKVVTQIIVNGIDLKLCDFASNASNVSKIELRNYLTKIITEKNNNDMKSFIESILFLYLYDEKHTFDEINSKQFIIFALNTFKKTNSKDRNIGNIKNILDKWGTDSGIYLKFSRVATRIDYTKGIYLYFICCIQKYC